MGLGGKIMAGIALIVIAMVIKRYMKKREKVDRRNQQENTNLGQKYVTEPTYQQGSNPTGPTVI